MYGKYFVGKSKLAVITLTGMEGRGERGEGRRPPLLHPIDLTLSVDNPMMGRSLCHKILHLKEALSWVRTYSFLQ